MSDSKVSSVLIFLASYPFTKKINAVGISNLPSALRSYRHAKSKELKHDAKARLGACLMCLFHSSTVFSAVFGQYPKLIQAHAIFCIGLSVRDSVYARKEEEEQARMKAEKRAKHGPSITARLRTRLFGPSFEEDDRNADSGDPKNTSKTVKAQKVVKKTKGIMKGKRDSATDDIVWGAFQVSFVLLDQTIGQALAYAWLLFLLTVLEEALLNPKLSKEKRMKRLVWIVVTGFICQNLIFSDFCGFWLRLGRYVLALLPI